MWCRECQQDVPAVAMSVDGPLVCTRCEAEFEIPAGAIQEANHPADTGVSLEGYNQPHFANADTNPWQQDESEDRLRRIGQQLRTAYRHDSQVRSAGIPHRTWGPEALVALADEQRLQAIAPSSGTERSAGGRFTLVSRVISLLLLVGVAGFVSGVGALIWSAAFSLPESWQWGMTATLAAEGTLTVALTWMALRLWHNSRRLNQQIASVDDQIHQLEHLTGSLAAGRMSSSQYYYTQYNQGASSHMLLANLQGQVEQLSTRLAG